MLIEFRLPQFGMGMSDGTIIAWLKREGDRLVKDEPLLEVEAAKTTIEVGSPVDGVLKQIVVQVDENVPVQTVIAVIESEGTATPAGPPTLAEEADVPAGAVATIGWAAEVRATPLARRAAESSGVDLQSIDGTGPGGKIRRRDIDAAVRAGDSLRAQKLVVQVEPRARRAARELGLDLAQIAGSGPNGRVVEADVRSWKPPAPAAATPEALPERAPQATFEAVPHSGMRQLIAKRLTESKQTVPHFYLVAHCRIDALLEARARIKAAFPADRVSVNDFVIKALANALVKVPDANVTWTDAALRRHFVADVAFAVATEGGLITPVIRGADAKSVRAIAAETMELAGRARAGGLSPREYKGGSASVSNLGMYGVEEFSAIINPPHSCILAVGAGVEKPVIRDGAVAAATVMTCTLSVDHRAVDGAVAAQLLAAFKAFVEEPVTLLG